MFYSCYKMLCNYINCYKCFPDAFCYKIAICSNLLFQNPNSKIVDRKTEPLIV